VICEVILAHFSEDILDENGRIDQTKTDWVARLGGDWYCRASGDALFEVAKPSIHKGIGVDSIPNFIKNNPLFTGNDLGRLGNIEKLPSSDEVAIFIEENPDENYEKLAEELLNQSKIKEAWMALLGS
jgi:hypothetical protein